ncbi:unnamed protein product, partial [Mesorhabditis belari]|uniref:TRUD domain-containing protein n=1 Tax=Mesorhabditis belari TaxID=2138241 RepID=A0AAF3FFF6_9BILA
MEINCGMGEYLGDRTLAIPVVLKLMYSDFVVNEILEDKTATRILKKEEIQEQGIRPKDEVVSVPFPDHISEAIRNLLTMVFEKKIEYCDIPIKDLEKNQRKVIHEFVRNRYRGQLSSETRPDTIRVSRGQATFASYRRDVPKYCHFTLVKENKDSGYALNIIAKFLGIKDNGLFKMCGIKDRRAVTTQRISVTRVSKERLMDLNRTLRGMSIYDCEYSDTPLKLGAHWGNRFDIILRSVKPEFRGELEKRGNEMGTRGFINYFGTQRFGTFSGSTASIGREILRRQWEAAVQIILEDKDAKGTVAEATREWNKTKDAKQALSLLKGANKFASIEGQVLNALVRGSTWQQAILALPTNTCSLYVHAYQSLLWNKAVTRRVGEHGEKVIDGDVDGNGSPIKETDSHFNVHIPLPGTTTPSPHYVESWYNDILLGDGLEAGCFKSLQDRFSIGDSVYRPIFLLPENVTVDFINYENEKEILMPELKTSTVKEVENGDRLAMRIAFNLPSGSYATVALRQLTGFDMSKQSMKELSENNPEEEDVNNEDGDGQADECEKEVNVPEPDDSDEPLTKKPKSVPEECQEGNGV